MTFKSGDPNKLLIGGAANDLDGELYAVSVTRGAGNHITGFSGQPSFFADGQNNDGGVAYGPGNVLFYARYPNDAVGEIKPGSTSTDKVVDLDALGVTGSVGGLNFVPAGFPGAGQLKVVSYDDGTWYTLTYSANASGTYNITAASHDTTLPGGPEGFTYVPPGSALFSTNSMLQAEYDDGNIVTYELDASGNPKLATRTAFITGLEGAEGAVIDPVTGDFLFSTFGGGDHLVLVQGFVPPPTASPSPSSTPTPSATSTATVTPAPTPTGAPTPSPSPTTTSEHLQGDADCNGVINGRDALILFLFSAGLPLLSRGASCPDIGIGTPAFGDLNCDGVVDGRDALGPLAFAAEVSFLQEDGCTPLNLPLQA